MEENHFNQLSKLEISNLTGKDNSILTEDNELTEEELQKLSK